MKKSKISSTETSKRNLTLFRPPSPPPPFFQIPIGNLMGFHLHYVSILRVDAYFFYGHLCVGGQKRQFFRKIMKCDSYLFFFYIWMLIWVIICISPFLPIKKLKSLPPSSGYGHFSKKMSFCQKNWNLTLKIFSKFIVFTFKPKII